MTECDIRCNTPEQAMKVAQGRCIEEKGGNCEGYLGVNCNECPVFEDGLKRRAENRKKERLNRIREIDLGEGRIAQLRKDEHYYRIIIGKRYTDNPEHPDIFKIERSLTLTNKERLAVHDLLV